MEREKKGGHELRKNYSWCHWLFSSNLQMEICVSGYIQDMRNAREWKEKNQNKPKHSTFALF